MYFRRDTSVLLSVVFCVTVAQSPTQDPCHEAAEVSCKGHPNEHMVYCANNGQLYHGLCAFLRANCDHHLIIVGYGENCTHHSRPPQTTLPPPTQFELKLFKNMIHSIDDRLEVVKAKGIQPNDAKKIFIKQDHTNKIYERNTNCWAYGLDLTSISPWNSNLHNKKAGTLLSPRHVIYARHYQIRHNSTIRFIDNSNNVIDRRVIRSRTVGNIPGHHGIYGRDIAIGLLDSDVPANIGFSRVMPRNLTTFRVSSSIRIPTFSTDQEEKALIDDFRYYSSVSVSLTVPLLHSLRRPYYESKISGDSGNPTFFVVNNELVIIFVFTSGGAGGGTSIVHYYDEINGIMDQLGGGYQLTEVNLRGFLHHQTHLPNVIG